MLATQHAAWLKVLQGSVVSLHIPPRYTRLLCPLYIRAASYVAGGGRLGCISIVLALLPLGIWGVWQLHPETLAILSAYGKPVAAGQSSADRLRGTFSDDPTAGIIHCDLMWLRVCFVWHYKRDILTALTSMCRMTASTASSTATLIIEHAVAWQSTFSAAISSSNV